MKQYRELAEGLYSRNLVDLARCIKLSIIDRLLRELKLIQCRDVFQSILQDTLKDFNEDV